MPTSVRTYDISVRRLAVVVGVLLVVNLALLLLVDTLGRTSVSWPSAAIGSVISAAILTMLFKAWLKVRVSDDGVQTFRGSLAWSEVAEVRSERIFGGVLVKSKDGVVLNIAGSILDQPDFIADVRQRVSENHPLIQALAKRQSAQTGRPR
jgi:hypothetical protein